MRSWLLFEAMPDAAQWQFGLACCLAASAVACAPFAVSLPARTAIGRAPEILAPGAGSVQLSGGLYPTGNWQLATQVDLADQLAIEAAVLSVPPQAGKSYGSHMASAALRYSPIHHPWARLSAAVGPAIGCGGYTTLHNSGKSDCGEIPLAGGGYVEVDAGARFHPTTAIFLGLRYQLTSASQIPPTHWGLAVVGIQLGTPAIYGTLEGGVYALSNRTIYVVAPACHLTLGVAWGQ